MKESKYKIGQKVWAIVEDKIQEMEIHCIVYNERTGTPVYSSHFFGGMLRTTSIYSFQCIEESKVHPTKESLIQSLR